MTDTGVKAVVILVNQLAGQDEADEIWKSNLEVLLEQTGDIKLGLYECPNPYHRVLSKELVKWLASIERFLFLKETSGNLDLIRAKIAARQGTKLRFYNAHTPTLLDSLRAGADGFSGIAANFFTSLYAWMCKNFSQEPEIAQRLQAFFQEAQKTVEHKYFVSAKNFLIMSGLKIRATCREIEGELNRKELNDLRELLEKVQSWHKELGIPVITS
jgi:4-hydroxy-tetrahydrodipicolinate synthase